MKITNILFLSAVLTLIILTGGCADVTDGRSGGKADITREAVEDYLSECKLNSPSVAAEVTAALNRGEKYRKLIKDQNKKPTTLTAWIDNKEQNLFCITYYRDETCPKCHGTGNFTLPEAVSKHLDSSKLRTSFTISCPECNGKGYIKNKMSKRCWVLGIADYKNRQAAQEAESKYTLRNAPAGTDHYIDLLSSQDPHERLEACTWLNDNYILKGTKLIEITPILDRARFVSPIKDDSILRKIMGKTTGQNEFTVYQFWAGKGDKSLVNRAYYRVYVNATKGEVINTAFAPDKSARNRRRR